MSANDIFVEYLEKCILKAEDGIAQANKNNHIGMHIMFKSKKQQAEDILNEYYRTHVTETEKSGAV
jgi:hypothetical protein